MLAEEPRINDNRAGKCSRFELGLIALWVPAQPIDPARFFFDLANRSVKDNRNFASRLYDPMVVIGKFFDALSEIHALIAEIKIRVACPPDDLVEVLPRAHHGHSGGGGGHQCGGAGRLPYCRFRGEGKPDAGPSHNRQQGHDGQRMTDSAVRGTRDQYEQEQSRCSKYGHDSVRRDTARGKREQSHQDDSSQPKRQLQADHRREVILRSGPPVSLAKRSDGVDAAFQTCANRIREAPDVCPRSDTRCTHRVKDGSIKRRLHIRDLVGQRAIEHLAWRVTLRVSKVIARP